MRCFKYVSGLFHLIKNQSGSGRSWCFGLYCFKFKMKQMKTNIHVAL